MCVFWEKKFIDVKNSCTVTSFSWDTELSSLSPQILHSNFCLYIFEGFFFLEKRKIGLLDIVEIGNNKKRHSLKMPVLLRGQSILSRFLDGVLQVWPICKRIYSENFSFFLLFFSMLWSVKSRQLNYIKKEILST